MWQVVFTETAEEDLFTASTYIAEFLKAPRAAEKLLIEVEESVRNLVNFPMSCPLVSDQYFASQGVRFLAIRNYLAFYIVNETTHVVSIIRFLYGRRDWVALIEAKNIESQENSSSDI